MKIVSSASGLAAALGVVLSAGAAVAAVHNVLPETGRVVDGGRGLVVVIAQGEIKSDINPSNVAVATGGGLLPALIDAKIESDRAKKAEREIVPVRAALTGYDVDALAESTTQAALAKMDWFQAGAPTLTRDSTVTGKSGALDAAAKAQTGFFEYSYDLSPDFRSVRVALNLQLVNRAAPQGKGPEARFKSNAVPYATKVTVVVSLPSPSKDMHANAAAWSADDGRLVRRALAQAFEEVGVLTPRLLTASATDIKAMGAHDKKYARLEGYAGAIEDQTGAETLLFDGIGLVDIRTLAD